MLIPTADILELKWMFPFKKIISILTMPLKHVKTLILIGKKHDKQLVTDFFFQNPFFGGAKKGK